MSIWMSRVSRCSSFTTPALCSQRCLVSSEETSAHRICTGKSVSVQQGLKTEAMQWFTLLGKLIRELRRIFFQQSI